MNNNMNSNDSGDITQKDLLKLLFDQAQHNATREEVNALEARMDKRFEKIDERFEKVDERFEKLEAKFDKKFDRLNWLLITTLIGVIASLALQILK
ncbi:MULTISPECIES: hypothetical protein [Vibrio]|uniref:DUF1640 domain-containing protein n=2 Tax=Vibrio TaxID=662 RepID=A0A9X3CVD6_9VIBR|nr:MULTISPECIES: hypothetical protein [Vibrio]MCW8349170.1 hypothetical protein [Vibrio qingdaonensis]PCD85274.1 hypothetical protein COR52_27580 [Vibrio mediterranei]PRQ64796.1 hypothetical protein COR51_25790 [Vibrio mediterranei]